MSNRVVSMFSYAESYSARTPGWDSSVEDAEDALLSPEDRAALEILGNVMAYLGSSDGLNLDAYDVVQEVYITFLRES